MKKRILSGVFLLPLLCVILLKGIPLYLTGLILSVISIYEFTKALNIKNIETYSKLGYFSSFVIFLKNLFCFKISFVICLFLILLIINITYISIYKNKSLKDFAINIIGIIYIILGFDAISGITKNIPQGNIYVWIVFTITILSDTMAYFTGYFFGKHKLAPKLSPKKTIEGSVGAILFSILGCIVFGRVYSLNIYLMLFLGSAGSIMSQIGDLLASFVKRYAGIKDYGNIIPGHGGILDRFDSILTVSQFVYIVLLIFN